MFFSTAYVLFFSLVSLLPTPKHSKQIQDNKRQNRFLVLFPAYQEDAVIINSVRQFINQDYPASLYSVVVISDHMKAETNQQLEHDSIKVLKPVFEKSSKAKALQFAIQNNQDDFDFIVILDADNVVETNFLSLLNQLCNSGYKAIQCHRCAKNANNDVAVLDGVSEEINNTIFRKAHNRIGLSSALIGSGMCFNYELFQNNVFQLTTAGEDRELEALLLKQRVFIKYAEHINVYDEKVSSKDTFQRQRMRWMTAQLQSLLNELPYIPRAVISGNINFVDKTIQQVLIPRSILIVATTLMAILMTLLVPTWCAKWWFLLGCLMIALLIATPQKLRSRTVFQRLVSLPNLVWRMLKNLLYIDSKNTDFIHTKHTK
jgi:cellulose synthase/poly-beta-1,6-N-acetylglucosamine synthase-like glycosyltransferase